MKTSVYALTGALALALPAIATANDDEQGTIIVTAPTQADAAAQAAARTPGGTDVISHADYADTTIVSLRDALAFSPGVYLQPRYGQEVRISIRGSGLSRGYHMRGLTLLQDGVPINLADDNGDFQELDPIFLDHLEVYRGANAMRFGSSTLGGAVNGVTPNGRNARGLYARIDGGSFNLLRGLVALGGADNVADYWIGAAADRSDGDRDHDQRQSVRVHGNVGLALSDSITTRFYASMNRIRQELPGALTMADALTTPRKGNYSGDQHRNIDSLRVQNRTTLALGDGELNVGVFLNVKDLFHPIMMVVDQKSTDYGAFARYDWRSEHVELTLGGDWRQGSIRSKRFTNVNGRRGALIFDADQNARTASLYGELRYLPTSSLSLIAGAVYNSGWRRQQELYNPGAAAASNPPYTNIIGRMAYDALSPRIGILYTPMEGIQFYGNISRSAELPTLGDLAQISSFVPLKPQRATTYEIGMRGQRGIADWDIALYRADLTGEMLQYYVSAALPSFTMNADHTRHQGIEATLTLTPSDWLRLRQVYSYSDFAFRRDAQFGNNRLPVVPRHVYRADLRLGSDALHMTPSLEWVPQGAWADYRNNVRTDGYVLLGLSAGMQVRQGLDLFIDMRNLANKKAVGDISAVIAGTASSAIYYPVERRAVYGGVRARF